MAHHDLTRTDALERSRRLDLTAADVHLDVSGAADPQTTTFPVTVRWQCDAKAGTEHTFLDFIGRVDSVEINGHALSPEEREAAVSDGCIELHPLSEHNVVVVAGHGHYSRSGEGLHRYTDPEDGQTYLYTQYEPADARRVMPCFDQPDLRTTWRFSVTAPAGWSVSSNARAEAPNAEAPNADVDRHDDGPEDQGAVLHVFEPTASLPSYLTSVLAGPYHRVDSRWVSSHAHRPQQLPMTLWCRASMAQYLPAEELFDLTRQGLDFFTELFDLKFPFDSYEQAFVPEYNLGAMENPGLVTLTEDYLFPDGPTQQQRAARANTVLHEMAHMYFGDLVTIRWWEDLWLKESFAEFMGAYASAEATEFAGAWAGFAVRRKAWAYRQDALSTTHPIVAEIPDVAAALQNFDGITYAKGAAALKQLVAYVGITEFIEACRLYFRRHAWGSADLGDFLAVLAEASERDTGNWALAWLHSVGATQMEVQVQRDGSGVESPVNGVRLVPRGTVHQPTNTRPHRLAVAVYAPAAPTEDSPGPGDSPGETATGAGPCGTGWRRTHRVEVDVPADHPVGEPLTVPGLDAVPGLVLVNDDDLDYASFALDPASTGHLLENLGHLPNPMARSVAWAHLWSMVRQAELDPAAFLKTVTAHVFDEPESVVFETVLERALETVEHYVPQRRRAEQRRHLAEAVVGNLREAQPGSDRQTALARVFGHLVAKDGQYATWARQLLTGEADLPGLHMGPTLRWRLLTGLVASNHGVDSWIGAEAARDSSRAAQIGQARTVAARPTRWGKDAAWNRILTEDLSNDLLSATIAGFQLADDHLLEPYRDRYFAMLRDQWKSRSIGMATRVVKGLYPSSSDLVLDTAAGDDSVLVQTEAWLAENPEAPRALVRVLSEQRDERLRQLQIQAAAQS